MKLSRILLLSLISLAVGITAVLYSEMPPPTAKPILQPKLPFTHFVYGVGTVEPHGRPVRLNPNTSGVIKKMWVQVGEIVPQGKPLFQVDDAQLLTQLKVTEKALKLKQKKLNSAQHSFNFIQDLNETAPEAVPKKELISTLDALKEAQAELYLAQAERQVVETKIQQTIIKAPFQAQILSINCRIGQNSDACLTNGVLELGDSAHNLRVNIDEYDVYRFKPNSKAIAVVQGHPNLSRTLIFDHLEPALKPKTQLSSKTTERTDTRVLQAVYRIESSQAFPVYIGQRFDVYIQSPVQSDEK